MYYFHTQIQRIVSNMKDMLPCSVVSLITDSLGAIDNLTSAIIEPLTGWLIQAMKHFYKLCAMLFYRFN